MPHSNAEQFAIRLRSLMAEHGVTRERLATALGVNRATVSQWRGGKFMPPEDRRADIARVLGVSPRELDRPVQGTAAARSEGAGDQRASRSWVAHFRAELTDMQADDTEVDAAEQLVQSPEALAFLRTGNIDLQALDAMRWMADPIRAEIARRHGTPDEISERDRVVLERILAAQRRHASKAELAEIFVDVPDSRWKNLADVSTRRVAQPVKRAARGRGGPKPGR